MGMMMKISPIHSKCIYPTRQSWNRPEIFKLRKAEALTYSSEHGKKENKGANQEYLDLAELMYSLHMLD